MEKTKARKPIFCRDEESFSRFTTELETRFCSVMVNDILGDIDEATGGLDIDEEDMRVLRRNLALKMGLSLGEILYPICGEYHKLVSNGMIDEIDSAKGDYSMGDELVNSIKVGMMDVMSSLIAHGAKTIEHEDGSVSIDLEDYKKRMLDTEDEENE